MTVSATAGVVVGRRDGAARFGGAKPCGTRFCPNCAPRIQATRRAEIDQVITAARDEKRWNVLFLTLTIGHSAEDRLADLLDVFDGAWRGLTRGGFWNRLKRRHGLRHFIRVTEEQQGGEHGWHPHFHVLLFLDPAAANDYHPHHLGVSLTGEWHRLVTAAGYRASNLAQRLIEPAEEHLRLMSSYFTKQVAESFAWEMTGQATKRTHGASRNPAELLADAVDGDPGARRAWVELEEATRGRRMIAYSAHCRTELALEPSVTNAEASEDAAQPQDEDLVKISREDWQEHASRAGFREDLAALVETALDASQVLWWLHDRGIRASVVPPRPAFVPQEPQIGPPGAEWLALP